jgi:hypothetical protein
MDGLRSRSDRGGEEINKINKNYFLKPVGKKSL